MRNRAIISFLEVQAVSRVNRPDLQQRHFIAGFELHTHPDVIEKMTTVLDGSLHEVCQVFVYGYGAFSTLDGRVFVVGDRMKSVALLLPEALPQTRLAEDIGPNWYRLPIFEFFKEEAERQANHESLKQAFRFSLQYAQSLDTSV